MSEFTHPFAGLARLSRRALGAPGPLHRHKKSIQNHTRHTCSLQRESSYSPEDQSLHPHLSVRLDQVDPKGTRRKSVWSSSQISEGQRVQVDSRGQHLAQCEHSSFFWLQLQKQTSVQSCVGSFRKTKRVHVSLGLKSCVTQRCQFIKTLGQRFGFD